MVFGKLVGGGGGGVSMGVTGNLFVAIVGGVWVGWVAVVWFWVGEGCLPGLVNNKRDE